MLTIIRLDQGDLKDSSAAAEALSHLSQGFSPVPGQFPPGILSNQLPLQHPMGGEPGPSSHPRGPPNLGQLSAIASALQASAHQGQSPEEDGAQNDGDEGSPEASDKPGSSGKTSGRRGGRSAAMSNDEWARIRKDNHVCTPFLTILHASLCIIIANPPNTERSRETTAW